ncbi:MAG: hypothetical protein OXU21_07960 [Chloroflexota bacterium]|nr:hypothetical protein [Chloroflexota bacterium]
MTVTSSKLGLWHVPTIVGTFVLANLPRVDVVTYQGRHVPALMAAGAALPAVAPDLQAVGAWTGARLRGFGLLRCAPAARRASVEALTLLAPHAATALGDPVGPRQVETAEAMLQRLAGCAAAQGRPILVARLREDSPYAPAFAANGFSTAAIEYEYARSPRPLSEAPDIEGLRPQEAPDAWDVMQLYRATTPAAVQRAEARTMEEMEQTPPRSASLWPWLGDVAIERHVVADEHGLAAWLELRVDAGESHRLTLMLHPRRHHMARTLINWALWRLGAAAPRAVRIRVREPHSPIGSALETLGFTPGNSHALMVKDVAVRAAEQVRGVVLDGAPG